MNAKSRLIKALEVCLEDTPIDQIKVSDIADAADVSRQTFYRLYADKYELVKDFYQTLIIDEYYEGAITNERMYRSTLEAFRYFRDHPNVTRNMFFSGDDFALKHFFREASLETNTRWWAALGADMEDERMQAALKMYSYGNMSVLMDWFKTDMSDDLDVMCQRYFLALPVGVFVDDKDEFFASLGLGDVIG